MSITNLSRLQLGIAPDSWGVWFPEDPHQVTWRQYLDEIARAATCGLSLAHRAFCRRIQPSCATNWTAEACASAAAPCSLVCTADRKHWTRRSRTSAARPGC